MDEGEQSHRHQSDAQIHRASPRSDSDQLPPSTAGGNFLYLLLDVPKIELIVRHELEFWFLSIELNDLWISVSMWNPHVADSILVRRIPHPIRPRFNVLQRR